MGAGAAPAPAGRPRRRGGRAGRAAGRRARLGGSSSRTAAAAVASLRGKTQTGFGFWV